MKNNLVNFKEQRTKRIERQKEEQRQRNEFNQKWIELLTAGEIRKEIEFYTLCEDSPSLQLAIMKYRGILKSRGRGKYITVEHLKRGNICKEEYLVELLQELFLEPILDCHIEYFFKNSSKKYRDMNDAMEVLYRKHMEDLGRRFLTVVSVI